MDLLRRAGQSEPAEALARALVLERTGFMKVRSAWANTALEAGDLATATLQASVPVERGGATGASIAQLASVLLGYALRC